MLRNRVTAVKSRLKKKINGVLDPPRKQPKRDPPTQAELLAPQSMKLVNVLADALNGQPNKMNEIMRGMNIQVEENSRVTKLQFKKKLMENLK